METSRQERADAATRHAAEEAEVEAAWEASNVAWARHKKAATAAEAALAAATLARAYANATWNAAVEAGKEAERVAGAGWEGLGKELA